MGWIKTITNKFAIFLITLMVSSELFAGDIFEYRRLADLDKDLKGSEDYINYIKSISISAHVVGVHLGEVLGSDEFREVILPGGKLAYIKSRKINTVTSGLRWTVFFLRDQLLLDDYDVAEEHREALENMMSGDLYLTHEGKFSMQGKPYGMGPALEVPQQELVKNSSMKITGVRGDLSVFMRGDRYKLIPLGGAQNDHLLIEIDVSKMPRGCGVGAE